MLLKITMLLLLHPHTHNTTQGPYTMLSIFCGLRPVIIKGVIFLETITLTINTQVNFAHSACYWRSMPVL